MLDTEMLIGANFVAGTEAAESDPQSEDRRDDPRAAGSLGRSRSTRPSTPPRRPSQTWSRTTPAERSALLLKLADAIERDAEAFAALEALNCGKPRIRVLQRRDPGDRRLLPLLRRRRAHDARPRGGRVSCRATPR